MIAAAERLGRENANRMWAERTAGIQRMIDEGDPPGDLVAVWCGGKPIPARDPDTWRSDAAGRTMEFVRYGTKDVHGWEIDHVRPLTKGGTHAPSNLQPLHWRTNREKSDTWPWRPTTAVKTPQLRRAMVEGGSGRSAPRV